MTNPVHEEPLGPYDLAYQPRVPQSPPPAIALVGCGGISRHHLQAYRQAGYAVVAMCDVDLARAKQRRDAYYPNAMATDQIHEALAVPGVGVVDITTHPQQRPPLIEAALRAGKHVLSQKPFVLDLGVGRRLADLADEQGVLLAVNQNARWAPHFSYLREAVATGLLGELHAAHFAVHWDHSWVEGTPFEQVRFLILYDYAIHWFDMLTCVMGDRRAETVTATDTRSPTQAIATPLLGQASVTYENAQATLVFDGHSPAGAWGAYTVVGSKGLLRSEGRGDNERHHPELITPTGCWRPRLTGEWFDDGFHGAMAELLVAIDEGRQPSHAARGNLRSLELCFAAVESAARGGAPIEVGSVRTLREA